MYYFHSNMEAIYPTLLHSCNLKCETNSWYNMKKYTNVKMYSKTREHIETNTFNTFKIILKPTLEQKNILKLWLDDCIDVYNMTNQYLKQKLIGYKPRVNWINIRKELNDHIREICSRNNLNKHTADYATKHCVEMWKSAISNHKFTNKFSIENLRKSRTRKNLTIEPSSCSKSFNAIFLRELGEIESNLPLSMIQKNSVLQYTKHKNEFAIIVPTEKAINEVFRKGNKCGIDIGCRTFLTTYSENESYEIGTHDVTYKTFGKYYKKLDSLNCYEYVTSIKKATQKYNAKLRNKIKDMHNKVASMLVKNYNTIVIGNVSTKKMVSNDKSSLPNIVKRRLLTLSHFRFRMKLETMCQKYGTTLYYTDEYMTSKMCCNCGAIKQNLGGSKTYECGNCSLKLDRDINAAINIYNI